MVWNKSSCSSFELGMPPSFWVLEKCPRYLTGPHFSRSTSL
ncbi:VIR_N domain-containing protein [Psidium guajava]|nr:VIR_N domain-containing protein [Psidium guajava]